MITQPRPGFKITDKAFMSIPIEKWYEALKTTVKTGRIENARLVLPCCLLANIDDIVLNGKYPRTYTDIQLIEGKYVLKEGRIQVQRILCRKSGHTHALLFDLFIPYQKYTIRYVLYRLKEFFESGDTIEEFWLKYYQEFSLKTMYKWLTWLKDNLSTLTEMGIVKQWKEKRESYRQFTARLCDESAFMICRCLKSLNVTLFQRHKSPPNTDYRKYGNIGKMIPH